MTGSAPSAPLPAPRPPLARLIERLVRDGLDPRPEEIADALWLGAQMQSPPGQSGDPRRRAPTDPGTRSPAPGTSTAPGSAASASASPTTGTDPGTSAGIRVYPGGPAVRGQTPARSVRAPEAPLLPASLDLGRALRKLRRLVPSRSRRDLDEAATVEQTAEQGFLCAVHRGVPEPWFELVLVIDRGLAMQVWEQTLDALARLAAHSGAFRRVRVWYLDSTGQEARLHPDRGASRTGRPQELSAPGGRCLVLVASDCVAPAWHSGAMSRHWKTWSGTSPTALLHLLPPHRWSETGIGRGTRRRLLPGRGDGLNAGLRVGPPSAGEDPQIPDEALKLPILSLDPAAFATWGALVNGQESAWIAGVVFDRATHYAPSLRLQHNALTPQQIEERLERFLATAAPRAQRLAGYLAAVPLALPVMRLVQQVMLPRSRPVDLAELAVSGLLKRVSPEHVHARWLHYEFHDGVRDALVRLVPATDGAEVLRLLSDHVAEQTGRGLDFQALLADREATGPLTLDEGSRYFAVLGARVLRRLGGAYRRLADQLDPPPAPPDPYLADLIRLLLQVYERLAGRPTERAVVTREDLVWLIAKVRGNRMRGPPLPQTVRDLVSGTAAWPPATATVQQAWQELDAWWSKATVPAAATSMPPPPRHRWPPLPTNWQQTVAAVHRRLDTATAPFAGYEKTVLRWRSHWTEAQGLRSDQGIAAIALLPSRAAARPQEAQAAAWSRRVTAARTLRTKVTNESFARVLDLADDQAPGFILLEAERDPSRILFQYAPPLAAAARLQLATALCDLLDELNGSAIHVLDLSPRWIAFNWTRAQRHTLLLDPTAVVPDPAWLPECRGSRLDLGPRLSAAQRGQAQVFLVGALTLMGLLGADDLDRSHLPSGRCATLAALIKEPTRADEEPMHLEDRLANRLAARLTGLDGRAIAQVLGRSVREDPAARFSDLPQLRGEIERLIPDRG